VHIGRNKRIDLWAEKRDSCQKKQFLRRGSIEILDWCAVGRMTLNQRTVTYSAFPLKKKKKKKKHCDFVLRQAVILRVKTIFVFLKYITHRK